MLSQLMVVFGFFALVLVMVYWVNRSVSLFDELIADGHSAGIFLEFTLLSLPTVIAIVLPMAAFGAAVYVTNRMSNESEMTVLKATGLSPWRLARPVLVFGILIGAMMAMLSHVLVPASIAQLRLREGQIAGSVSARLLHEGTFLHPTRGVTFYIREITPEGELRDVYLSDRRDSERAVTYTAATAYVLNDDEGPRLTMQSGLAQTLRYEDQTLSTTDFTNLTYDISGLVSAGDAPRRRARQVPTWELLTDTEAVAEEVNDSVGEVLEEAHSRFELPLLCVVAALIGYAALMASRFSRFGVTRQIVGAIFLLVLIKIIESVVGGPVRANGALWPLIYLPSVSGLGIACLLLWQASRPFRPARRANADPVAEAGA
ncbi:MAG: LPS export ABC transporter permease LptF [Rhodobacteraceae bacterium]|jgi:lipopolysaccharide export system permease protein|uniref:Lipopolysaccharide export system permease protein n=1 Tax=Salipiger profundus TaxID=1229727 RepID=A0A1U7DA91_9RHOB|nr:MULTISPECIES: LPS export ABC transporter permease LptF [Salipiger]APX25097.1 lipopolysaccharide export system permease protein [Salipiger profundus]MAB05439.1 LPS export ABC transporter permease LptF [Paracoccaceae bacterium]GGA15310.1 LPS export ABC transporter permease LptF [Salipiger profundus]SFD10877.1 lipopolysaccharide export system permease protein [Salipiger profundus]